MVKKRNKNKNDFACLILSAHEYFFEIKTNSSFCDFLDFLPFKGNNHTIAGVYGHWHWFLPIKINE